MKIKQSLVLVSAALMLSACVSQPTQRALPPAQPQAQGVEGSWVDPNGLVSTFSGGRLETRTSDGSNQVMASGTYTVSPDGLVQINLYSNIKKTTSQSNCLLVNPAQLNCTADSGAQFSLTRRG